MCVCHVYLINYLLTYLLTYLSNFFRWTLLRSPYGMPHEPSVCRLSSVTLLHRTQKVELFGNIFAPSNSLGTGTLCIKILTKKFEGVLAISDCSRGRRGMKNWCFLTNISLYFESGTRYAHSYNERWIGTCAAYAICRMVPMTLNDPLTHISRSRQFDVEYGINGT